MVPERSEDVYHPPVKHPTVPVLAVNCFNLAYLMHSQAHRESSTCTHLPHAAMQQTRDNIYYL